jgi:hypothetical protein
MSRIAAIAKSRKLNLLLVALFVLSIVASACGAAGGGAPAAPGQYSVQKDSIHFDGERYQLYWADNNGSLHQLDTRNLRLVRDPDRTFLEVTQGGGDPILHLREDEPIAVQGRDHQGAFSSPWFPFLIGAAVGNAFGGGGFGGFGGRGGGQTIIINNPAPGERSYDSGTATYRYPPTGTFGRDDSLHGTVDTSKPQTPDYSKISPSPYATAGKSAGTGGGVAASNKSGPSTGTGVSNATSGQSGGTGSGVAASGKGGFANGPQSYSNSGGSSGVGAGSRGVLGDGSNSTGGGSSSSGTTSKPSTGQSGSKGIGGARAPSGGRR